MSHIVWTTLPTRSMDGMLFASILVSPRIDGGTLAGTSFADWPATLASATFGLAFSSGVTIPATVLNAPFDSTLWQQLFGSANVQPFAFRDNSKRPLWSFPVDVLTSHIDALYTQVAQTTPTLQPLIGVNVSSPLQGTLASLHGANLQRIELREKLYAGPRVSGSGWEAAATAEQSSIAALPPFERSAYLAKRFYSRPSTKDRKDDDGNLRAHLRPKNVFDFHQKLALLADHPYVLRKLGIIIDVAVPFGRVLQAGDVWVVPSFAHDESDATPKTHYQINGDLFLPAPSGPQADVELGVLKLGDASRFVAVQGEPDGDAHKVVDFASNMMKLVGKLQAESLKTGRPAPPPQPEGLPARRTSGFVVARKDRATELQTRFAVSAAIHLKLEPASPEPPTLYAEDVVRGYRVDVRTGTSGWKSLVRRRVTYDAGLPDTVGKDVPDEGYVDAAGATSDPDPSVPDLYVHEAIFGWEGWSLAVPRPGRIVTNPEQGGAGEQVAMPDRQPPADFPLKTFPRVEPGSLTPLRFGQSYAFRARVVDLAGNSLAHDDAALTGVVQETPLQTFKRFEPISPPTLVLKNVLTEGESVEHLVIRSDGVMDPSAYAAFLNTNYPDKAFPAKVYQAKCARHVALPKTSQIVAEQHGKFDGAFASGADRNAWFRVGTREEGTFADKRIASLLNDGYIDGNPNGAMIVTPPQVPWDKRREADGGADVSSLTVRKGDPLAPGEYVVCGADQLVLPYLPDPAAGGMIFFRPGGATFLYMAPDASKWPDVPVLRLELGSGAEGASSNGQVSIPPGRMLRLRYASTPARPYLPHMAYYLDQAQGSDVEAGRHWMLTPSREVTFVHAVPKPLKAPVANLKPIRNYDDTFVTHEHGSVGNLDGPSTGHVDLVGTWDEYLDVPSRPLPNDIAGDPQRGTKVQVGHAFQMTIGYDDTMLSMPSGARHELGDTRHRIITYKPVATTRYREYFPPALTSDPANITVDGPTTVLNVPSSARPHAPKVVSVVPTFKWEGSPDGRTSIRRGNGVRIYLERPWYSSGQGERLAALVYRGGKDLATFELCSHWGRDPVWDSKSIGMITAASFKNAAAIVQGPGLSTGGLRPAEKDTRVDAAAFDVEFSESRRLWFCDIELQNNTYFPFVRLALARYQKESLPDVELSAMVYAEFTQLVPDRSAWFTPSSTTVGVRISGPVAENLAGLALPPVPKTSARVGVATQAPPRTHRLVAYFQTRTPGAAGEMGWLGIGGETLLPGYVEPLTGVGRWSATLTIPTIRANVELRVVVEEREYFLADGPLGTPAPSYRLVYLDYFKLR